MRLTLAMGLLLCVGTAAHAQRPQDFANGMRLEADGTEALYEVILPAAVYRGIVHADLADVRLFNAAGEVVPHAWRPQTVDTAPGHAISLPLFPLKGDEGTGVDGISVRLRRAADGSSSVEVTTTGRPPSFATRTVGYLIDLTALDRPLRAIELEWPQRPDGFAGRMRVDASDDLASWRTLVAAAPLVSLEIGSQRLHQKRIELPLQTAGYLRLSWVSQSEGAAAPELLTARGQTTATTVDPAREWTRAEAVPGGGRGEYVFDLRGHYPVDRVRVQVPAPNTVAQIEWLARDRLEEPWRHVASGVVYRLRRDGGEIVSPEVPVGVTTDRYWLLRVDQRGGGIGSGMPMLEAGWVPHAVVFAARGEPPFQLAYGNRDARQAAHAIGTLLPARSEARDTIEVSRTRVSEPNELGGEARRMEGTDWKRWTLWGSLVMGVLILGGMAWRLVRRIEAENG